MSELTLVLGGVRSGKSVFAEQLAAATGPRVLYIATAVASDAEMEERVRCHRARRPASWGLIEEPLDLGRAVEVASAGWDTVLLDSVSGWLGNLLLRRLRPGDPAVGEEFVFSPPGDEAELAALLKQEAMAAISAMLTRRHGRLIAVSDETGLSLVPPSFAGRLFQDLLGSVNQSLAAAAESVYLVVAGLPLQLKCAPDRAPSPPDSHDSFRR